MSDAPLRPIPIDVGEVLQGSVASLYANLVTRPTGRAVRMAIETQLAGAAVPSVSLIDLSEVVILDFSCADEVVAKLLQRYLDHDVIEAFFVFRGVREPHRDQIEVVLHRHGLVAVAETAEAQFQLIGDHTPDEARVFQLLEERGVLSREADGATPSAEHDWVALRSLAARRVAFHQAESGRVHALSRLVRDLL